MFFVNFWLQQTKTCHADAQSRSFYQNTEIKQSKNPSSIAFFRCRREYKIAIDLAAFDETDCVDNNVIVYYEKKREHTKRL